MFELKFCYSSLAIKREMKFCYLSRVLFEFARISITHNSKVKIVVSIIEISAFVLNFFPFNLYSICFLIKITKKFRSVIAFGGSGKFFRQSVYTYDLRLLLYLDQSHVGVTRRDMHTCALRIHNDCMEERNTHEKIYFIYS